VTLRGAEVPRFLERIKLSPHQVDLRDVLALSELRGTLPREVVVIGVQPGFVDLSTELTEPVQAALPAMVHLAARQLQQWGILCFEHEAAHA
jgi:hydrogenase maturation protease